MKFYSILLCTFLAVSACQQKAPDAPPTEEPEEEVINYFGSLLNRMVGSFDSHEQAEADSNYYNISLHMYPIWEDKNEDGIVWLYVEQALAEMQDKPYRQRVYKVEAVNNKSFKSSIYTLNNPDEYIGAWQNVAKFDSLPIDSIALKDGCAVVLHLTDTEDFAGSTNESDCKSTLRGSTYATSEVKVFSNYLETWDRGFDDAGEHIWGAEDGPYIFKKIKNQYDEIYKSE